MTSTKNDAYLNKIFIGSIALEKNRWSTRQPSYAVSEWLTRFQQAGFDGVELWQNHALLASEKEKTLLGKSSLPMTVLNSYAGTYNCERDGRLAAAEIVSRLGSNGMKFNVSKDAALSDEHVNNVLEWLSLVPKGTRMLCECHGGTFLEKPDVAREVFNRINHDNLQTIIHGFTRDESHVKNWFEKLGDRITHIHVAMRDRDTNEDIRSLEKFVKDRVHLLREEGFAGSYTIEFTRNIPQPGKQSSIQSDDIEKLFELAVQDMKIIQEALDFV